MDTKSFSAVAVILVAILGALSYFSVPLLHQKAPPAEYQAALEKWKSFNLLNYDLRIQKSCFCDWRPILVKVRNGLPEDVRLESPEEGKGVGPLDLASRVLTVEGAFADVARAYSRSVDSITVSYDAKYGYPVKAVVDESKIAVDDQWTLELKLVDPQHVG
jgi:hypothetical protein